MTSLAPPVRLVAVGFALLTLGASSLVTLPGRRGLLLALALTVGVCFAVLVFLEGVRRVATGCLLISAFLMPMNGLRAAEWLTFADVLLLLAGLLLVVDVVLGRRAVPVHRYYGPILAGVALIFIGGVLGTVTGAADVTASFGNTVRFLLGALTAVLIVIVWHPTGRQANRLLLAWALGAAFNVVLGFFITFTITGRALGASTHPNHLALAGMLAAAVFLSATIGARSPAARLMAGGLFVVCLLGVIESGSRAGLLGLLVASAVVFLRWRRTGPVLVGLILGVLAGLMVLSGAVTFEAGTAVGRVLGNESSVASDQERSELRELSLERARESPIFGQGFEFALQGHNVYLQVLSSAGVLGMVGLGAIVLGLARALFRRSVVPASLIADEGRGRSNLIFIIGGSAGLVGFAAASVAQNVMWDRYLWMYLAATVAVGVAVSEGRWSSTAAEPQRGEPREAARPTGHAPQEVNG